MSNMNKLLYQNREKIEGGLVGWIKSRIPKDLKWYTCLGCIDELEDDDEWIENVGHRRGFACFSMTEPHTAIAMSADSSNNRIHIQHREIIWSRRVSLDNWPNMSSYNSEVRGDRLTEEQWQQLRVRWLHLASNITQGE